MTYLRIFSLEGMAKICCHSSDFLIRPTPTHDYSLGVDVKISNFWFAHPTIVRAVKDAFPETSRIREDTQAMEDTVSYVSDHFGMYSLLCMCAY